MTAVKRDILYPTDFGRLKYGQEFLVRDRFGSEISLKGVDAIAQILKLEGVGIQSCFPSTPLIDPIRNVGIRTIMTRQERGAIDIASGYGRVSNGKKIGVSVMQEGVGIENSFAGIAHAFADAVPLLVLPGQYDQHRIGIYPNFFDAMHVFKTVSKWVDRINFVDRIPEMMRRAFTFLRNGRVGPVVLEVPNDVAGGELGDNFNYSPVKGYRTSADPRDVKVVARAILNAKHPIIRAGEGVLYSEAWDELRELAELAQIPVMTTIKGKSAFPEDHPLSLGYGGCTATKTVNHFLTKSDLVFSIGSSLTSWWLDAPIPPGKTIVQLTIDEFDVNKDQMNDYVILGDAKLVIRQLIDEVNKTSGGRAENKDLIQEIGRVKDEWLKEWMPKLTSREVPINPYRVFWDFMQTVDRKNTIVTPDSGNPRDQLAPFYESLVPRGYVGWGNATTLGFSLGAAIGAKLAEPQKMVVNFMGDASIGMTGMDFETAAREKIPILTVVLNNSVLSGYGTGTQDMNPSKYKLYGDYAKLAEALGGYGETVQNPDEIIPAIGRAKKAMGSGVPALLNVISKEELAISKYW